MLIPSLILGVACSVDGGPENSFSGSAYPIAPVSLRQLCESADFIGVVSCGATFEVEQPTTFAQLGVNLKGLEAWKGELPGAPIEVTFMNTGCPSPPSLPEGEQRLVFLARGKEGGWYSVGMSYGSKPIDALEDYRWAVHSWLAIEGDSDVRRAAEYAWSLSLLSRPVLQQEALYELAGRYWNSWEAGKFSREASQEDAMTWLRHFGSLSLFDSKTVAVFPLLHRSSPAAAAAWWWGRFESLSEAEFVEHSFDLQVDFFVWSNLELEGELVSAVSGLKKLLVDEPKNAEAIQAMRVTLHGAFLDYVEKVSFPTP